MRLSNVLCKQHIDRWFKRHWLLKRRRYPAETGAEASLIERGVKLVDPLEIIKEPRTLLPSPNVVGTQVPRPPLDETHPQYRARACREYADNSLLIEGLAQAQVLTNTVQVEGLPDSVEEAAESLRSQRPAHLDQLAQRCILNAQLFDAYQEKLPKIKDPLRPAFTFPRVYGVADHRRNRIMTQRLIELCGTHSGVVVRGAPVQTFLQRGGDLVRLRVAPGALLCGRTPRAPHVSPQNLQESPLPNIFPLNPIVSLKTSHFYDDREIFPVPPGSGFVKTAVFHFDETKVVNQHEEPVTEQQIIGRSLTHTFTVALAAAKQERYGEPVTMHAVHTDGQWFHFVALQLNSTQEDGPRNIVWSSPVMRLFSMCRYMEGRPVLSDYNPKVLSTFLAVCGTSK